MSRSLPGRRNSPNDEVRATVQGDAASSCWSPAEQALIAAVDALHHRATFDDAEFAALSAHYDEAQILEIMLLCGFYRTVSYLANGLRLPLEETRGKISAALATRHCEELLRRSNPGCLRGDSLDCFAALAMTSGESVS